jgi:hypothetical protein
MAQQNSLLDTHLKIIGEIHFIRFQRDFIDFFKNNPY